MNRLWKDPEFIRKRKEASTKKVICVTTNQIFPSVGSLAKHLGMKPHYVSFYLHKNRKIRGKYYKIYQDEQGRKKKSI